MASQVFSGYVYDDAGAAISGATVNLYDVDTVTPLRATTTTNASGYWSITHATEGRFDVEVVNGSSIRRRKYLDEVQLKRIEVADFFVRNPADTFDFNIVPAAITADRTLNLPLITGTKTLGTTTLVTGTYTGDGATSQAITGLGVAPVYVRIWQRATATGSANACHETTDTIIDDNASGMSLAAQTVAGWTAALVTDAIIALGSDGFTVDDAGTDSDPNTNTRVYNFIAIGGNL